MKESKLIEMRNQIEVLGRVATKITHELQQLKVLAMGDHQVIKRMSEFNDIIKQLEDEQKDANGAATGDSGSTDAGLELGDTSN